MTTPAGIAPSTSSFSIALGRGDRFSAKGTGDLDASVDEDSTMSSDSGSGDGSTFHSVLNKLYAPQAGPPKNFSKNVSTNNGDADAKDTGSGNRQSQEATGPTAAMMTLPFTHDGTHAQHKFSPAPTSTSTATAPGIPADPEMTAPPSTTAASDPSPISSSPVTTPVSDAVTSLDLPTVSSPPSGSGREPAQTPSTKPSGIKGNGTAQQQPKITANQPSVTSGSSVESQPPDPANTGTDDEASFPGVLSQVFTIQPPAASAEPENNNRSGVSEALSAKDDLALKSTTQPPPVIAKASSPVPVEDPAKSVPQTAPKEAPATSDVASSATNTMATVVVAEPPAIPAEGPKNSDPSGPGRPNVMPPSVELRTASTTPVESGEVAFAARLTPTENSLSDHSPQGTADPLAPDVVDSKSPVTPPDEAAQSSSVSSQHTGARHTSENNDSSGDANQNRERATSESHQPWENTTPKSTNSEASQRTGAEPVNTETDSPAVQLPDRRITEFSIAPALSDLADSKPSIPADAGRVAPEPADVPSAQPVEPKAQSNASPAKPSAEPTQAPADVAPSVDRSRPALSEPTTKVDMPTSAPQPAVLIPAGVSVGATRGAVPGNPAANPSPAARMQQVVEMPAAPQPSGRDITVRVPDATERGTDVRFLERGGEVRVMVRTSDPELAQTLRGGLNDFVGRMEHTGLRTEVWRPGQGAPPSPGDSQQHSEQRGDSRGSGSGKNQQGSQEREDSRQQSQKPGWVEELETSLAQSGNAANQ